MDIALLIDKHTLNDTTLSTAASRKTGPNDNLFFPYTQPSSSTLIGNKNKSDLRYANCLIDYHSHGAKLFFRLENSAIDQTVSKNNRIEDLQLFSLDNFECNQLSWENYEQMLFFYLSTLPFDYINISELTKTSLLNKLCRTIVLN